MVRTGGGKQQLKKQTLEFGTKSGGWQKPPEATDLDRPSESQNNSLVQSGQVPRWELVYDVRLSPKIIKIKRYMPADMGLPQHRWEEAAEVGFGSNYEHGPEWGRGTPAALSGQSWNSVSAVVSLLHGSDRRAQDLQIMSLGKWRVGNGGALGRCSLVPASFSACQDQDRTEERAQDETAPQRASAREPIHLFPGSSGMMISRVTLLECGLENRCFTSTKLLGIIKSSLSEPVKRLFSEGAHH